MKAVSSTKNRAKDDEDDESRGDTNEEDSNSVDARKRNGKLSSNDAGASGNESTFDYQTKQIHFFLLGDPNESGDYDEDED